MAKTISMNFIDEISTNIICCCSFLNFDYPIRLNRVEWDEVLVIICSNVEYLHSSQSREKKNRNWVIGAD